MLTKEMIKRFLTDRTRHLSLVLKDLLIDPMRHQRDDPTTINQHLVPTQLSSLWLPLNRPNAQVQAEFDLSASIGGGGIGGIGGIGGRSFLRSGAAAGSG